LSITFNPRRRNDEGGKGKEKNDAPEVLQKILRESQLGETLNIYPSDQKRKKELWLDVTNVKELVSET